MTDDFPCPHCGAVVRQNAKFCRECGADDSAGWDEHPDTDYGDYEHGEDFDYDEFVRNEFPDHATPAKKNPVLVIVVILLLVAMLAWVI